MQTDQRDFPIILINVVSILPPGVRPIAYDVTCRHPTAPCNVHRAATTQLITATVADHEKKRHHHIDTQVSQSSIDESLRSKDDFRSFSCESYGGLHHDAALLIEHLCILAQDRPTVFSAYEVKYGLGASIACAIQRYNAAMILENIAQAAHPAAHTAPTYHAPNHQLQPLSSTYINRRSKSTIHRVRPVDTQLVDSNDIISDSAELEVSLGLSETSSSISERSVLFEAEMNDAAESMSMSVQGRTSSNLSLVRALSVASEGGARSVTSTFAVDNRSQSVVVVH